jgi:hypothetical protein
MQAGRIYVAYRWWHANMLRADSSTNGRRQRRSLKCETNLAAPVDRVLVIVSYSVAVEKAHAIQPL